MMQPLRFESVLLTVLLVCLSFERAPASEVHAALELTTEVINQTYCIGDADLDGVRLRLRLRYRNIGDIPIILHKSSTTIFRIIVRKSQEGEIENDAQLSVYSSGPWKVSESSLKKTFVILQPKAIYETETVTRVFVTRDDAIDIQGAVSGGDHYLQLTIGTWGGTEKAESDLRRKWESHGVLWTNQVRSKPMRFTIARKRAVRDCN